MRHRLPRTDLDRMTTMVTNFFLHILPAKVHPSTLNPSYTFGLGVIAAILFIILTVTGFLLMFFYVPSVERAYQDMLDLQHVVSHGRLLRNMHRWAAHAMVAIVFLHMVRVFYTGSYKPPREFNWLLGVALWLITLFLSFTGYLLPWDQLAYWAIMVGTSIASYPPWVGDSIRFLLIGGTTVGQGALLRFYVLHVAVLPALALLLLAVHFWRVRKDGGLSRAEEWERPQTVKAAGQGAQEESHPLMGVVPGTAPMVNVQEPDVSLPSWPHLTWRLLIVFQVVFICITLAGYWFDAPLLEIANPERPENPAKAPWYFLGLQELVGYSALTGGVIVPGLAVLGILLIPYVDSDPRGAGNWFAPEGGGRVALASFLGAMALAPILTWLQIHYGVRVLFPEASQFWTDLINPASVLTALIVVVSLLVWRRSRATRMPAIVIFSGFMGGFLVYTIIGMYFRGPNWVFIWPF